MKINIANYYEAPRFTAKAGEALPLGSICKVSTNAAGDRVLMKVTSNGDLAKVGAYAFAFKVSSNPLQVTLSTVPSELGNRIVQINSGDFIVEARRGTIMEYDPSLLDDSLNPTNGGTLPVAGDALEIKAGLPCKVGTSGSLTTSVLRCYDVVHGHVRIELI